MATEEIWLTGKPCRIEGSRVKMNIMQPWRRMGTALILAVVGLQPCWAQTSADRRQEVEMALDHYAAAKTPDQRASIIDYLQHLDRKMAAAGIVDHIIVSRTGTEATAYGELVEVLKPEGCEALLDSLRKTDDPLAKGKLIVALRHCQGPEAIHALAVCLDDKRRFPFEAHGAHPRRVCDAAYDELFLKLRSDPHYGLDASPRKKGLITEGTPVKSRDALIAKLKARMAGKAAPSPAPKDAKPATAAITEL
jgi:hypothetical protein